MVKVWVVSAKSESGDDFGPYAFLKKPSDKKLEAFFRKECPGEFGRHDCESPETLEDDGPGDWGSYLCVDGPHPVKVR